MADQVHAMVRSASFQRTLTAYVAQVDRKSSEVVRESATRVRAETIANTPFDTGRLQGSWLGPIKVGARAWKISTTVPYAPIVEYGGYRGVGPKTVALPATTLGTDIPANAGIYSTQAPYGMLRRALAKEEARLHSGLQTMLQEGW